MSTVVTKKAQKLKGNFMTFALQFSLMRAKNFTKLTNHIKVACRGTTLSFLRNGANQSIETSKRNVHN